MDKTSTWLRGRSGDSGSRIARLLADAKAAAVLWAVSLAQRLALADFRATNFIENGELPLAAHYVATAPDQSMRRLAPDYDKLKAPALSYHALYSMKTSYPWLAPNVGKEVWRKAQEF